MTDERIDALIRRLDVDVRSGSGIRALDLCGAPAAGARRACQRYAPDRSPRARLPPAGGGRAMAIDDSTRGHG